MKSRIAIAGRGRLGSALAPALRAAGYDVAGPHGRGFDGSAADLVLLCVPDSAIGEAASAVSPGPIVGHCSGASGLECLGDRERLALHPLMTVTPAGARFEGAGCAVGGSTARARSLAHSLATDLGMLPFDLADDDRPAYHAAASVASNYLITIQAAAARLAATAGIPRDALVPLARATIDNWATLGEEALTGPIARGDEITVARQREAVSARVPELAPLFDALATATRDLVRDETRERAGAPAAPAGTTSLHPIGKAVA